MISVVLYGRNDDYGYNLHKRAALSLNCIAEVLTDRSDEIIFVDYNTPNDFPTFPEAIRDTLTGRARGMLRILRVRPHIHERYRSRTGLVALEPIARNVAVRRSNPSNRWILSTNTDMILVPQHTESLSKIAEGLPPGYFHAPRIEIPEMLWESLDRRESADNITIVHDWGRTLHLDEIIVAAKFIRYDNPGDFQLLLRDDLFEHHGFHEDMLLGWHVDSNIAKRMSLKYATPGDLGNAVFGYHCDHTRQITPAHRHTRSSNDWRRFCDQVEGPSVPEQALTWGCANDEIEEIRLLPDPTNRYVKALHEAVGYPLASPRIAEFTAETYNKVDYDPAHLMPFLSDMFVSMPRDMKSTWFGTQFETLSRFATVWDSLGFTGKLFVDPELVKDANLSKAISYTSSNTFDDSDAFIFDFGGLLSSQTDNHHRKLLECALYRRFAQVVDQDRLRLAAAPPGCQIYALNAINNQHERFVGRFLAAAATPCATYIRHGYVLPDEKTDWLPFLEPGEAATRNDMYIESRGDTVGLLAISPERYLEPGTYRLAIRLEASDDDRERFRNLACILLEISPATHFLATYTFTGHDLNNKAVEVVFNVPVDVDRSIAFIKIRFCVVQNVSAAIREFTVQRAQSTARVNTQIPDGLRLENWLPILYLGSAGRRDRQGIILTRGRSGYVIFGPYWHLPKDHYVMVAEFEMEKHQLGSQHIGTAEILAGGDQLAVAPFIGPRSTFSLRFDVADATSGSVEVRVWNSGEITCLLQSISVRPLSEPIDLLPYLSLGDAGRRDQGAVQSENGRRGHVVCGPYWPLPTGAYELIVTILLADRRKLTNLVDASTLKKRVKLNADTQSFDFSALEKQSIKMPLGNIDVFNGTHALASCDFHAPNILARFLGSTVQVRLPFHISVPEELIPIETRISTSGRKNFLVKSVLLVPAKKQTGTKGLQ